MSCSDPIKNIDAKEATFDSLLNLYKFKGEEKLKPTTKVSPFPEPLESAIFENINTNLDDLDNVDSNIKNNLFIKDNIKNNIYQNCVIRTNNPWFTTSSDYSKCKIVEDIELDNKLVYNSDKTAINLNLKSNNKLKTAYCPYPYNTNKAYCENRWYDWIITPNYYLGNTYYKDNSKFGELDVYKCFEPCSNDSMPYVTSKGENKCIKKKYFSNGIFANKLMFSPIGLINLIGNVAIKEDESISTAADKNLLYKLYLSIRDYNIENKMDETIYEVNDYYKDFNDFTKVSNHFNEIYNEFKKCIDDNILNGFDNNNDQDYKYSNLLTYKHRNFNEDESEMYTLKGLDVCGALIPPILHHTWVLANIFKPLDQKFITDKKPNIITAINLYNDQTVKNAEYQSENQNQDLTFDGYFRTENILNNLLCDKLFKVFKNENIAIRLKNIFFKAVNICYNNKTDFSINIIDKTKKTFDTYKETYSNVLQQYSLTNDIYNLENVIFNNEHKYYLDYELYDLSVILKTNNEDIHPFINYIFDDSNKYKYYYSIERLEAPTCPKGYQYDSKVKNCEKIIEKPIIDKNAPVEDEMDPFNIPEIIKILTMFLHIIIVIVILYIIYIFYDIFGEIILTVYNYLYMKIIENISNLYISIIGWTSVDNESYEKIKAEIDYNLANIQYKNLEQNNLKILSYMAENKIPTNQGI
jgi:hypothetical protein